MVTEKKAKPNDTYKVGTMRNFTFFNPTRIEFGKDKEAHIGQYLKEFGVDSALILYGSERVKRNGLFDRVAASLEGQGHRLCWGSAASFPWGCSSRGRESRGLAFSNNCWFVWAITGRELKKGSSNIEEPSPSTFFNTLSKRLVVMTGFL